MNDQLKKDLRELQMAANIADTFHGRNCCAALDRIEAAINRVGVPDGWQLVPKEPTPDMMQAGSQVWKDETNGTWGHSAVVYTTMITAAPQFKGNVVDLDFVISELLSVLTYAASQRGEFRKVLSNYNITRKVQS